MSAHTPGPWMSAAKSSSVSGLPIVSRKNGRSIARVTVFNLGPGFENHERESMANAALLAAAPDLLEALHECEDYFDNRADADCDQDGYIPNEEMKLLQVVREALKKAGA